MGSAVPPWLPRDDRTATQFAVTGVPVGGCPGGDSPLPLAGEFGASSAGSHRRRLSVAAPTIPGRRVSTLSLMRPHYTWIRARGRNPHRPPARV